MKCLKCGEDLRETDLFCPKCGEKVQKDESNNNINNNVFTYEKDTEREQGNGIEFTGFQNNNNNNGQTNMNNQTVNTNNFNSQKQNQMNNRAQMPKKKSNTALIFIIVVIIIVILLAGIVFFIRSVLFKSMNSKSIFGDLLSEALENTGIDGQSVIDSILSGEDEIQNNNSILNITSGNNSSVTLDKKTAKQVELDGFRLYIPDNLKCEKSDKGVTLQEDNKWSASLGISEGNVVDYMQDNSLFKSLAVKIFNTQGVKISNSATVTVNGIQYVLFETESAGETFVFAIGKINSDYMAVMSLVATDGNTALSTLSEIIKNAQLIK